MGFSTIHHSDKPHLEQDGERCAVALRFYRCRVVLRPGPACMRPGGNPHAGGPRSWGRLPVWVLPAPD